MRIKLLPTEHQAKIETARVLAVSKASYGWAACTPIPKEVEQVDIAVRKCSGGLMRAAKHLRNLLLGANAVFEGVMLDNQRYHAQTWCQYDLAAGKICLPGLQRPGCLLASQWDSHVFQSTIYSEKRISLIRKIARLGRGARLAVFLIVFLAAFSPRTDVPQSMS